MQYQLITSLCIINYSLLTSRLYFLAESIMPPEFTNPIQGDFPLFIINHCIKLIITETIINCCQIKVKCEKASTLLGC